MLYFLSIGYANGKHYVYCANRTMMRKFFVPHLLLIFLGQFFAMHAKAQQAAAVSHVDIPIAIDLKPVYRFANSFIDTLYTSPNYPTDWVEDGCDKRYQYRFVRGPMSFSAGNDVLLARFTGRYLVRGSTRICTGLGKTPWTPPCSCGTGSESERRVDAGFAAALGLLPDYSIDVKLQSIKPRPLDKCEICAFGLDITPTVVAQVKQEIDGSLAETAAILKTTSVKPYVQQLWDTLQTGFPVPGFGRLLMHPQALRFSRVQLRRDSLFMSIGLSVRPELSPVARAEKTALPLLSDFAFREGFAINVSQILPYDSLDAMLNKSISGKEIELGKGILSKTIVIDSAHLNREGRGVRISMYASKGVQGIFSITGIPAWDSAGSKLYFDSLNHQINLEQKFLQNISSLFDKTILRKLQDMTTIDISEKTDSLKTTLNSMLNSQLYSGVKSSGSIRALVLTRLVALDSGIFLSGYCNGTMRLQISVEPFLSLLGK